jgi:hypothetical protein
MQLGLDTNTSARLIIRTSVGDHLRAFYHRVAAHVDAPIGGGDPAAGCSAEHAASVHAADSTMSARRLRAV